MHVSGQIKTVPIRRIHHATHETIHPLTHTDVDVHGEGLTCLSSYPTATNPDDPLRVSGN